VIWAVSCQSLERARSLIGMLTRTSTVVSAALLAVIAVPVVWLIGYQDHPWREPGLAILTGLVAVGAGMAVHAAGRREVPPVSRALTVVAIVASVAALACALLWAWLA
jgi:lipopolysaccharide export LptBFGC system permease protein LptF